MKRCLAILLCAMLTCAAANGQSPPSSGSGSTSGGTGGLDVGLLEAQSISLATAPAEGSVSLLDDGSGVLFVGARNAAMGVWAVTGTVAWERRSVIAGDFRSEQMQAFEAWPDVVNAAGLQATNKR